MNDEYAAKSDGRTPAGGSRRAGGGPDPALGLLGELARLGLRLAGSIALGVLRVLGRAVLWLWGRLTGTRPRRHGARVRGPARSGRRQARSRSSGATRSGGATDRDETGPAAARAGVAEFQRWLARQSAQVKRDIRMLLPGCTLGGGTQESILASMEAGDFGDWRIPLWGLAGAAERAEQHETAVALCDWARRSETLGVVGKHFVFLSGYVAAYHLGRIDDAFRLACEDVDLLPALLREDPMFEQNREDSLSYAEARAMELGSPERIVPAVARVVQCGVFSPAEGSAWIARMVEEMEETRLAHKVEALREAAAAAGLRD